jgi:enoyl-CoA hydratase/carnithine racemase
MSEPLVLRELKDGVLTVTLNRPDKLNAFNTSMAGQIVGALAYADHDDAVRAVIITGAGRAFCAGADLEAGADTFNYDALRDEEDEIASPVGEAGQINYAHPDVRDVGGIVSLRAYRCLKPVIAAINGPAVGVGITMTLPMDIRMASTTAKFGFVFTRRGIVPEAASSWFLPRIVGISRAMEWCATGRVFSAEEAFAGGLVRSLHAPEDLLPAAMAIAREIADNAAPVSVALTRQMLWRALSQQQPMEAHRLDSRLVYARGRQRDAAEGVTSFLEKRPAHYTDRVSHDMPNVYPWWVDMPYK